MAVNSLLEHLRNSLARQHLLSNKTLIVVAVSGGPDSLALLHLLCCLRAEGGPQLHVAHLDHGFRGAQSAAEAQFVAQTAAKWNIPVTVGKRDLPTLVTENHQNRQAAARAVRYAFLAEVAQANQAEAVAVAHQADDQAETVLLHLLRGAGPAGLRGMQKVVPWQNWGPKIDDQDFWSTQPCLIRPLLERSRAEIEQYCQEQQLTPQLDPSNTNQNYTRNRIRADLLPHLTTYNPQITAALHRTAQVCAEDYAYFQTQLENVWPKLAEVETDLIRLRPKAWAKLHPALQRYALRRAASLLLGNEELSYDQIEAGRKATTQGLGFQQTLAQGLFLRVEYDFFLLTRRTDMPFRPFNLEDLPQLTTEEFALTVPFVGQFSETWAIETAFEVPTFTPFNSNERWRWWVALDAKLLAGPLFFRRRRSSDSFRPAGGRGSRSLQNFFVDNKIPRDLRAAWPVLATPIAIVWIAGLRADGRFLATAATDKTLWIVLKREPNAPKH